MRITSQKGFSGIDARKNFADGVTSATNMTNFRVTDSGSLEKRPAVRMAFFFSDKIDAMWSGILGSDDIVAVVSDGTLFIRRLDVSGETVKSIGTVGSGECTIFEFNGSLYVKTQSYYGKYDGNTLSPVEGYIPCVAISCTPDGSGELFEQINLLSDKRKQLFSSDGHSLEYKLAESGLDELVSLLVDGKEHSGKVSFDAENGILSFEAPPAEGLNNISVIYSKKIPQSDRDRIMKCTKLMLFGGNSDGRAFLWGNDELPNYRFYSELADGVPSVEYFPINAFSVIGNSKINCIVQQYDKQLIFTKNEAYYSYSELRDDGLGNLYTSFPVFSLNGGKGCLIETNGCVIDNRPVTLCDDGLNMWESTSVENERNAICFSAAINRFLKELTPEERASLRIFDFQANREFYLVCGDIAYVYNYGNGAWYRFDGFTGDNFSVNGNRLFFSNGYNVYVFSDANSRDSSSCFWESPFVSNSQNIGDCDVNLFEADIFAVGPIKLSVEFEKSNGETKQREFFYPEGTNRFLRISMRPSLKRAMPFRLKINEEGSGSITLHGVSIKTRQKERSKKYGIL